MGDLAARLAIRRVAGRREDGRVKYPRTLHLPWSPGATSDDKILTSTAAFHGKQVVVTEKMDGENCTIGQNYVHARSVDSANHPSRNWVKNYASEFQHEIPDGWRLCGENLFAKHAIFYEELPSYFMLFSIWDDRNMCLSWSDTVEYAKMLGVKTVPVLYKGTWDEGKIAALWDGKSKAGGTGEGYVVRLAGSFPYSAFAKSLAKFVRPNHVEEGSPHWKQEKIIPNKIIKKGALVGTDVAEIYAISPDMLHKMIGDGEWFTLADSMWGHEPEAPFEELWAQMQEVIREHGGAVFQTGGDGAWDVRVEGAPDGQGYTAPYGTADFGKTASSARVAFQRRMRTVLAGWWAITPGNPGINLPPVDKGGLLNAIPGTDPADAAMYNGDGPADMMGDFLDQLNAVYVDTWGRNAHQEELKAVFDFVWRAYKPRAPKASTRAAALVERWAVPPVQVKEARSYVRLVMFDFDGTLFRSWEKTPKWWKGSPLDKGPFSFFVRPESLDEPCVPSNPSSSYWIGGPLQAAKKATSHAATVSVLITGRVKTHKARIKELAKSKGLNFDHYYFNPGMSAARFKVVILKTLLAGYNTVEAVEVWENENMKTYDSALRATAKAIGRDISVEVHHVHVAPKELVCDPADFGLATSGDIDPEARLADGYSYMAPEQMGFPEPRMASAAHSRSIALMKWLSQAATRLRVGRHVYVVGGAVRNFIIDKPIKDIDVVVDSIALGGKKDSDWFAKQLSQQIPAHTSLVTNQYGVAILTIKGSWMLDGMEMQDEVIEIANARKESYGGVGGKGYKPSEVIPSTIEEDVVRREFTFNTLMWRLMDLANGPDKAEVVDLTGCGLRDLENREMRCPAPPDKVFSDDPSRLMRVVKFVAKYGFTIPPDLVASIKKNAPKMKQAPWESIGKLLVENVLNEPTAPDALKLMKKLGLLDVVAEMVQEQKPFASYLAGQLKNRKVTLLLDLLDLGLDVKSPVTFLTRPQQLRLREVTIPMHEGKAEEYLANLKKPPVDNMALITEFSIPKQERGVLSQMARAVMLEDPDMAFDPKGLQRELESRLSSHFRTAGWTLLAPGAEGVLDWGTSQTSRKAGGVLSEVKELIKSERTWLTLGEEERDELLYATRDNGDVGEETPGREDMREALRLKKLLRAEFPDQLDLDVDYVDEWVHLSVSLKRGFGRKAAGTGNGKSVGLFIPLPSDLANQFPEKTEDTSPAHVTFLYIGEVPKAREKDLLAALESAFIGVDAPVRAVLNGMDSFLNQANKVVFSRIRFDVDLDLVRDKIWRALEEAGFVVEDSHRLYNPHSTIAYMNHDENIKLTAPSGKWDFSDIELWGLSKKYVIPFGEKALLRSPKVIDVGHDRMARLEAKRANVANLRHRWRSE